MGALRPWIAGLAAAVTLAGCQRDAGPVTKQQLVPGGLACAAFSPSPRDLPERRVAPSAPVSTDADHRLILAASLNQGILVWRAGRQAGNAEPLFHWNHRGDEPAIATACGFSPASYLALTAAGTDLILWSTLDGRALRHWTAPSAIRDLALSANGRYALIGMASGEVGLFDIDRGGIKRLFSHDDEVLAVALSPDNRLALTGSSDRTARLWDMESGRLLRQWHHQAPVATLAFSADGNVIFTSARYDGGRFWKITEAEPVGRLPDRGSLLKRGHWHTAALFINSDAAISGGAADMVGSDVVDDDLLLVAGSDREVQLWDWRRQRQLIRWRLPEVRHPGIHASVLGLAAADAGADNGPSDGGSGGYSALASDGFLYRLALPETD